MFQHTNLLDHALPIALKALLFAPDFLFIRNIWWFRVRLSWIRYGNNSEHNVFKRGRLLATNCGMHSEMIFHSFGQSHADGWIHLIEWCIEKGSRLVCCLALCKENPVIIIISQMAILFLLPACWEVLLSYYCFPFSSPMTRSLIHVEISLFFHLSENGAHYAAKHHTKIFFVCKYY
jgi:hypothetical protein